MLLAGLHGHAQCALALSVDRHADDATRHDAHGVLLTGQEGGVGTSVTERHTEALQHISRIRTSGLGTLNEAGLSPSKQKMEMNVKY